MHEVEEEWKGQRPVVIDRDRARAGPGLLAVAEAKEKGLKNKESSCGFQ